MRRIALLTLGWLLGLGALWAQDAPPSALFEATQCLATGKYAWLQLEGQKTVQLAYRNDSFEGVHYMYVVVFTTPKRDQGKVFDVRMDEEHSYAIENNAQWVVTDKGFTFVEPPLGGNWTTNQLSTRVQMILKRKKWYEAEVKRVLKPNAHLVCKTDVDDVVHPAPKASPQLAAPQMVEPESVAEPRPNPSAAPPVQ